jgi:hypothetical protein
MWLTTLRGPGTCPTGAVTLIGSRAARVGSPGVTNETGEILMKKLLVMALAIVGGAVAMPGSADANVFCDAYDAVNSRLGHPVQAYCIDDPTPIDDLLELQP